MSISPWRYPGSRRRVAQLRIDGPATWTVPQNYVWDNGLWLAATGYHRTDPYASVLLRTNAPSLDLTAVCDAPQTGLVRALDCQVDGSWYGETYDLTITSTSTPETVTRSLPGVESLVRIRNSYHVYPDPGDRTTWIGTYLVSITVPSGAWIEPQLPVRPHRRIVVQGASIEQGYLATNVPREGWPTVLASLLAADSRVTLMGSAGRQLHDDCATESDTLAYAATIAQRLNGAAHDECLLTLDGLNNWLGELFDATETGAASATLVDEIHRLVPSARITVITPFPSINDGTLNSYGETLEDYRDVTRALPATRPWLGLLEGSTLVTYPGADIAGDGSHLTTVGQDHAADGVAAYLTA